MVVTQEARLQKKSSTHTICDLVSEGFTLTVTHLNPYMSTVGHFHPNEEVHYFVAGGKGFMECNRQFHRATGFVVTPPNAFHYVSNLGSGILTFLSVQKNNERNWFRLDKVRVAHEDDRRSISAIFNGDFIARQVKVLRIKQQAVLGGHYHDYREMFYVLEGQAVYTLEDIAIKEQQTLTLRKGDRLIIQPCVAHRAEMGEGTVMLEATEEPYISADKNDVRYEIQRRL